MTGGPSDDVPHSRRTIHLPAAFHVHSHQSQQSPGDDPDLSAILHDPALHEIAQSEGWLVPPAEVTRVPLRPWQEAVFWGLRAYIVVMLVLMGVGFAHVAAGK